MTERQDFSHWFEGEPRRASTGVKLVLFGALVPVFLAALLVGGLLLARGSGDGSAVTVASEAPLDCASPRDAWRWACQKTGAEPQGTSGVAAAADGPSTTGSLEQKSGRSSSVKPPAAEAADSAKETKVAAIPATAPVPPLRPAAREPDKAPDASLPATPAASAAPVRPAPEKAAEAKPASRTIEPVRSAAPPEEPVPTLSPRLAAAPAIREKPPATLAAKPEESAKPEPAASLERVIRARERPKPVVERDEEKPARLARHRVKAKESARRTIAAVREKPTRQRSRAARARVRDYDPADQGGDFRVSTTRTYILPDGRRMVTYAQPRGEDVRELVAEHRARFGARRLASPYLGGPSSGGGWYGAAEW